MPMFHSTIDKHLKNFGHLYASSISLPIRFVQAWVLMAGGLRRFVYDPAKLDPNSHGYMAGKLLHAAPGAAFGIGHIIEWMVQIPTLLFIAIILFTALELITGISLIFGLVGRLGAFFSIVLTSFLMLTFGWMGSTCIDEWTMASYGISAAVTLLFTGTGYFSFDYLILKKYPSFQKNWLLNLLFSGTLHLNRHVFWVVILSIFSIFFSVFFYNYYRGGIYSKLYFRTAIHQQNLVFTKPAEISKNGIISFDGWINAGPDTQALYIIQVQVVNSQGKIIEYYNGTQLNKNYVTIKNIFKYNQTKFSHYGIAAPLSSRMHINIMPPNTVKINAHEQYTLIINDIMGHAFKTPLKVIPYFKTFPVLAPPLHQ